MCHRFRTRHVLRLLLGASAALLALLVVGAMTNAATAATDAGEEADFVNRINDARSSRGLSTLTTDSELTAIARRWSGKMAAAGQLSHNPNLANEVTQDWVKLGENVGVGANVAEIHDAFMNSAPHRANILDTAFTRVGVGVVDAADGRIWVTEVFMRLRSDSTGTTSGTSGTSGTAATSPPTTAQPRPATTAAPATTARPPRTSTAPPPVTTPPTTEPPTTEPPTTVPPPPPPPPVVTRRLVLVLAGLHDIDDGR